MSELPIESIAKLELRPGDVLVVKTEHRLPLQAIEGIHKEVKAIGEKIGIPNLPVVVLDGGLELSVLTRSELETALHR